MKQDRIVWRLAVAFVLALALYIATYALIEHLRKGSGPWHVTFHRTGSGTPALTINQASLGISNVQIVFEGDSELRTESSETLALVEPKPVPFDVLFGQCVFMDLTSLPGTLAFDLFGHQVQLLPRVLTIDRVPRPWKSDEVITLQVIPPESDEESGEMPVSDQAL